MNDWSGIVLDIENNIKQYRKLLKIINPNKKITTISSYLNLSNVNKVIDIIKKNKITFFSLDIDSFDFYILMKYLNIIFFQLLYHWNTMHFWAMILLQLSIFQILIEKFLIKTKDFTLVHH